MMGPEPARFGTGLWAVLALSFGSLFWFTCAPQTVGTDCDEHSDCFSGERCVAGACILYATDTGGSGLDALSSDTKSDNGAPDDDGLAADSPIEDMTADEADQTTGDAAQLVVNGDFDDGFTGWEDLSDVCSAEAVIGILAMHAGRDNVMRMDTRPTTNCWVYYGQVIDVSRFEVTALALHYTWMVDAYEGQWSQAEVRVEFFEPGQGQPVTVYQHIRNPGAHEACGDSSNCVHETSYTVGNWSSHVLQFETVYLEGASEIDRIRVRIVSYDNAGQGADAYFDDIGLTLVIE